MGSALPRRSSLVTHSCLPFFTSRARKRLSSVEAMKTSPLAVATGPARAGRPVFCLSVGSCSVIPSGICHAMSPVDVLIAVRRPHGGFWHGQSVSPILTSNEPRPGVVLAYGTGDPSLVFSIDPNAPTSCVATKINRELGSKAMPPQFAPPSPPGNPTVTPGAPPAALYRHGVNGPALYTPPICAIKSAHAVACSALVSAAVTRSAAVYDTRASAGGFTGIGCVGNAHSPGTSLLGTGRSSTPKIGRPVSRFRM